MNTANQSTIADIMCLLSEDRNSSYSLEFWGTTLDCATKDRVLERPVAGPNSSATWTLSELVTEELSNPRQESFTVRNATFTYRKLVNGDTYQYYPCSGDATEESVFDDSTSSLSLSRIRVLVPFIETTCHPKLVKYIVTISHGGGVQNITYTIKDKEPAPDYTPRFEDFNGTFERFVQFSDAIAIYQEFASNLSNSPNYTSNITYESPQGHQTTQSRMLDNGTVVQTCSLEKMFMAYEGHPFDEFPIWPFWVFERRLPTDPTAMLKFDAKMANDLLINTTISGLSLNERFDIVNGTESHNFNVYRFEHPLTFFLPYCLALELAIPTIALGLIALYVHNHGVSAMNGGFLQLLMTTTGRTEMEQVITRGSGTLGGEESVSKELQDLEVRFGELKDHCNTQYSSTTTIPDRLTYSHSAHEAEESQQELGRMVNRERESTIEPRRLDVNDSHQDLGPSQPESHRMINWETESITKSSLEESQSEPDRIVNTQDVHHLREAQQAFYGGVRSDSHVYEGEEIHQQNFSYSSTLKRRLIKLSLQF
ncbi:hypothetical protein ACEQ8H_007642 [Pleosporales sp. CAS-2024a]